MYLHPFEHFTLVVILFLCVFVAKFFLSFLQAIPLSQLTKYLFLPFQGVRSHVYTVHILGKNEIGVSVSAVNDSNTEDSLPDESSHANEPRETGNSYKCEVCNKGLRNADGLRQHQKSKHGLHDLIRPSWAGSTTISHDNAPADPVVGEIAEAERALGSEEGLLDADSAHACTVCGLRYQSEEALERHMASGVTPVTSVVNATNRSTVADGSGSIDADDDRVSCKGCKKIFSDSRGRKQHENFCKNLSGIK